MLFLAIHYMHCRLFVAIHYLHCRQRHTYEYDKAILVVACHHLEHHVIDQFHEFVRKWAGTLVQWNRTDAVWFEQFWSDLMITAPSGIQ